MACSLPAVPCERDTYSVFGFRKKNLYLPSEENRVGIPQLRPPSCKFQVPLIVPGLCKFQFPIDFMEGSRGFSRGVSRGVSVLSNTFFFSFLLNPRLKSRCDGLEKCISIDVWD